MRSISEIESRESSPKSNLKKGYVKVFLVFLILIIIGFIIRSVATYIPEVDFGDPGFEAYQYLMTILGTSAVLLQNISLALFSFSTFLGAVSDRNLSKEVRRGMAVASGIGIIALVMLGASFQIWYVL
ncbi:MAG: hypothetical protein ACXAEX_11835 [Promethearchaeota archaeon]